MSVLYIYTYTAHKDYILTQFFIQFLEINNNVVLLL